MAGITKLYAERDIENLDTYLDHVMAMTSESLHSKSKIAAELAFRDEMILRSMALTCETIQRIKGIELNGTELKEMTEVVLDVLYPEKNA